MSRNDKLHYPKGIIGKLLLPTGLGQLTRKWGHPPFSVWDTRKIAWQARRRLWLNRGILSELGRKEGLTYSVPKVLSDGRVGSYYDIETSVFDPNICELVYEYWCPLPGVIIDPFAGGSVRGIVASLSGHKYWGCELSREQVKANKAQLGPMTMGEWVPKWIQGDSLTKMPKAPKADLIFSCPPYGNLEVYSKDPQDISSMSWNNFKLHYNQIILESVRRLKKDRFACFVVGNYRDKQNKQHRNLVGLTIDAFIDAGMAFYNDVVLINSFGTAGVRTGNIFVRGGRKVVKVHQNVLVFVKGDPYRAAEAVDPKEWSKRNERRQDDSDGSV